ncbi:MAG: peptide deformylase [Arenicella sp.]
MAVKTVLKMGDPRLWQISQEITQFDTPELHQLIDDLRDTMADYDGAGLAAPQIGVLQRVVIFGVEANPRYPDIEPVPETILINPEIEPLTQATQGMWEGCLSVPGMRGYVERPEHIRYSGYDPFGNAIEREVQGFHAIVVQHECDHLDGVLYPMRIKDMTQFGFESELAKKE